MRKSLSNILPYTILLISISSVLQWCSLPIGNTFLWWSLQGVILSIFFYLSIKRYTVPSIKWFLYYLIFSAIYGAVLMTENYWDWKLLVNNLMVFSLPIAAYVYANPIVLTKTLRVWIKYAWIILLILAPFLTSDAYGRFLVPFSFLSLFLPLLNRKYIVLTVVAYIITLILGFESRSDTLKFSVTILLGLFCYGGFVKKYLVLTKIVFALLFVSPIVFFILGATGTFNIFKIEDELDLKDKFLMKSNNPSKEISALVDTRTFLYVEEISSAIKNKYVVQGRSIARGYDSMSFGRGIDKALGIQRGERQMSETSILNTRWRN